MDQITVDISIYEFTREIKIRPTDKTIDAYCACTACILITTFLITPMTMKKTSTFLLKSCLCRSSIAAKASGELCSERPSVMPRSGIRVW